MIAKKLFELIKKEFKLELNGLHGLNHWNRVRENGIRLVDGTAANRDIVELFAFVHDVGRFNNGFDLQHGQRSAEFALEHRDQFSILSNADFDLLIYAVRYHSDGQTEVDISAQTCWDADRLDLGRIGVKPDPKYLCTEVAKNPETIEWAYQRSLRDKKDI